MLEASDRLLEFQLLEIEIDAAVPFDALSYRWEEPSPEHADARILCNGVELQIGRNLYTALHQISSMSDRSACIWVDYICIQQSHEAEKQRQILSMPSIYSKAHQVYMWLGARSESEDSDTAMDTFSQLVSMLERMDSPYRLGTIEPLHASEIHARDTFLHSWRKTKLRAHALVWKLLHRDWFSRVWTIQEAALAAPRSLVLCGSKQIPYATLLYFAHKAAADSVGHWIESANAIDPGEYGVDPENPVLPNLMHVTAVSKMQQILTGSNVTLPGPSTLRVMSLMRQLGCSQPEDRIWSVSALFSSQFSESLRAHGPLSARELYTLFAEAQLGIDKDVRCLGAAGLCQHQRSYPLQYRHESGDALLHLPSWVPDWTYLTLGNPLWMLDARLLEDRGHHLYEAATDLTAEICIKSDAATGLKVAVIKGILLHPVVKCGKPFEIFFIPKGADSRSQPEVVLELMLHYKTQVDDYVSLARQYFRPATPGHDDADMSDDTTLTLIRQTLIGATIPAAQVMQSSNGLLVRSRLEHVDPLFERFEQATEDIRRFCEPTSQLESRPAKEPGSDQRPRKKLETRTRSNHSWSMSALLSWTWSLILSSVRGLSSIADANHRVSPNQDASGPAAAGPGVKEADSDAHQPNLIATMVNICRKRRLFVTADHNMGIGPDIMQEGDRICIIHGACSPFVLRPVTGATPGDGKTYYHLVGDCYVHGLMDGEVKDMKELVAEDINLL